MGRSSHATDQDYEENEEDIPLHRQKVFSSGIRRQRVPFVKASSPESALALGSIQSAAKSSNIADTYLSLVMASKDESKGEFKGESKSSSNSVSKSPPKNPSKVEPKEETTVDSKEYKTQPIICGICKLTFDLAADPNAWNKHEASLAHQVSLAHSHPPSALDRSRMGLTYLESYGWDPDARQGLGVAGQGRQYPIKPVAKENTQGIGFREQQPSAAKGRSGVLRTAEEAKVKKMSAKDKRKAEEEKKRKAEKLHQEFYASDDVLRYMNSGSI